MNSILENIISQKQKEIALLKANSSNLENMGKNQNRNKSFKEMLGRDQLSIIDEIKRKSPSKGNINLIKDPKLLLDRYIEGEISAISVLTDEQYFAGTIDDLIAATEHLKDIDIPVLRKDFTIDESQIDESIACNANAILLIVSVLQEETKRLLDYANRLGIDAIVEVHNESELNHAVEIGADIIGINNRDLSTFNEDINVCLNLINKLPKNILTIAESAIKTPADVRKIKAAGFDAVLIGEALVKAENPSELIRQMRHVL